MPLYIARGISCDACGADFGRQSALAAALVKDARANGWYYAEKKNVALCPDCDGENE